MQQLCFRPHSVTPAAPLHCGYLTALHSCARHPFHLMSALDHHLSFLTRGKQARGVYPYLVTP